MRRSESRTSRGGIELLEGGGIEFFADIRIFCGKQARCREYCSETIEAAPAEEILND